MRRSGRSPHGTDEDEPSLFDLPLDLDVLAAGGEDSASDVFDLDSDYEPPPAPRAPKPRAPRPMAPMADDEPQPSRGRAMDRAAQPEGSRPRPAAVPAPPRDRPPEPAAEPIAPRAGVGGRLLSGLADLVAHLAVTAVALAGAHWMGATLTLREWPAFLLFVLPFSFLYTILPLAFWGQTLGMTWAGISSRNRDGEPLTFDQASRRWFGVLITTALVGLPLLIAIAGRSLTDLVSGSETYRA